MRGFGAADEPIGCGSLPHTAWRPVIEPALTFTMATFIHLGLVITSCVVHGFQESEVVNNSKLDDSCVASSVSLTNSVHS